MSYNGFAIDQYLDAADVTRQLDELIKKPVYSIRKDKLKEYETEYFDKKCARSKEMITKAREVIPGGVQHNLAFNYPFPIVITKAEGAKLVLVYGIGRMCHIAFWEPTFAEDLTKEEWETTPYRLGAKIHPLTVEQNAQTSFKSRTTLVPCRANTIGPGVFLLADYAIGGADGIYGRGMQWQGMSLWMTLRHETTPWITSTYIPTLAGKLFFLKELAGPLEAECN